MGILIVDTQSIINNLVDIAVTEQTYKQYKPAVCWAYQLFCFGRLSSQKHEQLYYIQAMIVSSAVYNLNILGIISSTDACICSLTRGE